jgi:hypothetical protein
MGHVAVPELSHARRHEPGPQGTWRSQSCREPWWRELEPQDTWQSQSYPVTGDGSRGHGARGGLGATVGTGGGSCRHEVRGGSGAALCQETGAVRQVGI